MSPRIPRGAVTVLRGAVTGLMVWTWYAAFEYIFSSLATAARSPDAMFLPWHWQLTAELISAYALIGLALGAVIGALSRSERTERGATLLTLIGAFLLNAGLTDAIQFEWADLETWAAAILLAILVWRSLHSNSWTIQPWLVASILVAGPFHGLLRIAFLVVAFVANFLIGKLRPPRLRLSSLRWQTAAAAALLAAAIAASLAFEHKLSTRGLANAKPVASPAPNIVLITMDTVRADHLSTYGYGRNTTPNLTAFAAGATLYRHTVAVSNMTLATHVSIFTGLYAGVHGAHYDPPSYPDGRPLPAGIPTLAETLAQRGYFTLGVVANYGYLSSFFGVDRGFQVYDVREPVAVLNSSPHLFLRYQVRHLIGLFASSAAFDRSTRGAEEIDSVAIPLLRETPARQAPVFLFLNYMDAHWPYLPPAPYDRKFPGKLRDFTDMSYKSLEQDLIFSRRDITPREKEHLISQYDGGIAYLDSELGRLFASLKELGLYDNSLIVVTSDHGENFGDRHSLQHGIAVYHDEVNVPLIVKYPRQNAPRTVDDLVSQIDLAPTILEVAGVPRPLAFAGQSLTQPVDSERYLYSEAFPPDSPDNLAERFRRTERAIYHHHQKFIESTKGDRELYDLDTDPEERRDLYLNAGGFRQASALKTILDGWAARQPKFVSEPVSMPQRVREQLKSLGYAQ
jgi:arylsulfatase A-like enzyme